MNTETISFLMARLLDLTLGPGEEAGHPTFGAIRAGRLRKMIVAK
jgi:hypothetical protein